MELNRRINKNCSKLNYPDQLSLVLNYILNYLLSLDSQDGASFGGDWTERISIFKLIYASYSLTRCGRPRIKRISLRHSDVRPLMIECFSFNALVSEEFFPNFKHLKDTVNLNILEDITF